MKTLIAGLFLTLAALLPLQASAGDTSAKQYPSTQYPWTDYFGSHYQVEPWGHSVRDPGGVGVFSVRWNQAQYDQAENVAEKAQRDIIINSGGLGSGRSQEMVNFFLNRMLLDLGKSWKEEIRNKAEKLSKLPNAHERIYWQFGNEINSERFTETIRNWDPDNAPSNKSTLNSIPYYVEYYLAPGVEALNQVAAEQKEKRFKIILGSVASYANPRAQQFMQALLKYKVEGLTAPSLKGRTVAELVDVISVHYIATANMSDWYKPLDELNEQYIRNGPVEALWSTEELGVQRASTGGGAVFSLQVAARYLTWWHKVGWSPEQGRAFLWGADVGNSGQRGIDGMRMLYQAIGDVPLIPLEKGELSFAGDNIDVLGFRIPGSTKKVVVAFPQDQKKSATLSKLTLPGKTEQDNKNTKVSTAHLITGQGIQRMPVSWDAVRGLSTALPMTDMSLAIWITE